MDDFVTLATTKRISGIIPASCNHPARVLWLIDVCLVAAVTANKNPHKNFTEIVPS